MSPAAADTKDTKSWKGRLRSLMMLRPKATGLVNHEQMLKLAKQIDAGRKDLNKSDENEKSEKETSTDPSM
ncbi:MAG: hypothetical protein ACOH5I_24030 [Oligoflexus sp.]